MAPFVIGISGPSGAGKSTLAEKLARAITGPCNVQGCSFSTAIWRYIAVDSTRPQVSHVSQDVFWKKKVVNYNLNESIDFDQCLSVMQNEVGLLSEQDVIIFEGFRIFHDVRFESLLHSMVMLDTSYEVTKQQRMKRSSCSEKHFDEVVWPHHVEHRRLVFDRYSVNAKWKCFSEGKFSDTQGNLHQAAFDFLLKLLWTRDKVRNRLAAAKPRSTGFHIMMQLVAVFCRLALLPAYQGRSLMPTDSETERWCW